MKTRPLSPGLERVRKAARRDPSLRFTALLHHVTPEALTEAYRNLNPKAAVGVDGVTWAEYGRGLAEKILDLHGRIHRGAYRAKPSRRIYLRKDDGRPRPIGIAALEDKIVQVRAGLPVASNAGTGAPNGLDRLCA